MTARVVSIAYTPEDGDRRPPDHYARVPVESAELVAGHGIAVDAKGGSEKRQLNVMLAEAVAELRGEGFRTAPGELGEQLVLAGLDPAAVATGTRLRLGATAIIEVTLPRTGCNRFAHIQGKPKGSAAGRIGVMARVLTDGEVRIGDAVAVVAAGPADSRGD
jgi:MOSC domain-containing protein YiiM